MSTSFPEPGCIRIFFDSMYIYFWYKTVHATRKTPQEKLNVPIPLTMVMIHNIANFKGEGCHFAGERKMSVNVAMSISPKTTGMR